MEPPMVRRTTFLYLLISLMFVGLPSLAQRVDPPPFMRAWMNQQRAIAERVDLLTYEESTKLVVDNPRGIFNISEATRVSINLQTGEQTITRVDEGAHQDMGRMMRPFSQMMRKVPTMIQTISRMHVVSKPEPDLLQGRRAVQIALASNRESPLVKMEVWFDESETRLLQSRMHFRTPAPHEGGLVVTTQYTRFEGLDVPSARHMKGQIKFERRLREYTILLEGTSACRGYAFVTS